MAVDKWSANADCVYLSAVKLYICVYISYHYRSICRATQYFQLMRSATRELVTLTHIHQSKYGSVLGSGPQLKKETQQYKTLKDNSAINTTKALDLIM